MQLTWSFARRCGLVSYVTAYCSLVIVASAADGLFSMIFVQVLDDALGTNPHARYPELSHRDAISASSPNPKIPQTQTKPPQAQQALPHVDSLSHFVEAFPSCW